MIGLSNGPGFTPQKTQFFEEKMLRLLEIFFLKNSSPFFLKPWRVGTSNINILLIGAIKNYNFFYCHFLLRPFLSEMFAGPFHQAKAESSSRTVNIACARRARRVKNSVDFSRQGFHTGWHEATYHFVIVYLTDWPNHGVNNDCGGSIWPVGTLQVINYSPFTIRWG